MTDPQVEKRSALTYSAIILAAIAIAFSLRAMKSVMVPFVIALFLYYIFAPITDVLKKRLRVPHFAAVTLSLTGAIVLLFITTAMVARSVETLVNNFSKYEANVQQAFTTVEGLATKLNVDLDKYGWDEITEGGAALSALQPMIVDAASRLPSFISNTALVLIFFGYLLSGKKRSQSPFLRKVSLTINRYLVIKVTVSFATGVLVWLILTLVGLELAFVFGVAAFALNFVPSVGSLIATLLPAPVALGQFGFELPMFLAILGPGAVQFAIGNVIEPLVQGEGLDLHPITVLLSLMFWFTIWGIPGMLIAAPLTSVVRIYLRQTEWGQPMANLLSGRI